VAHPSVLPVCAFFFAIFVFSRGNSLFGCSFAALGQSACRAALSRQSALATVEARRGLMFICGPIQFSHICVNLLVEP
jgi:hypothetical protein